jgi:hypothetical protein
MAQYSNSNFGNPGGRIDTPDDICQNDGLRRWQRDELARRLRAIRRSRDALIDSNVKEIIALAFMCHTSAKAIAETIHGGKGKGGMAEIGQGSASRAARDLGQGWKVNPYVRVAPGETFTLGEIQAGIENQPVVGIAE